MHFSFKFNRTWLNQAGQHKMPILGGFLAIICLSLAHYAGFLFRVPLPIVAVAGMPLAKGVTATFLFYIFFSAVLARVLAAIIQLLVLPFLALVDWLMHRFRRKMDFSNQRRFVKSHTSTIKWEGYIWIVVQLMFFTLLLPALYIESNSLGLL